MNQYDGNRNRSLAFVQNGGRPPCFPFKISSKGIGNELCDWFIVMLVLPIPIKQLTLDRKRRNQKGDRKKLSNPCDSDSIELITIAIPSPFFDSHWNGRFLTLPIPSPVCTCPYGLPCVAD